MGCLRSGAPGNLPDYRLSLIVSLARISSSNEHRETFSSSSSVTSPAHSNSLPSASTSPPFTRPYIYRLKTRRSSQLPASAPPSKYGGRWQTYAQREVNTTSFVSERGSQRRHLPLTTMYIHNHNGGEELSHLRRPSRTVTVVLARAKNARVWLKVRQASR